MAGAAVVLSFRPQRAGHVLGDIRSELSDRQREEDVGTLAFDVEGIDAQDGPFLIQERTARVALVDAGGMLNPPAVAAFFAGDSADRPVGQGIFELPR